MKQSSASTLSQHLLREAERFLLCPQRLYPTRSNLDLQRMVDNSLRKHVEWRKTFASKTIDRETDLSSDPRFLNELYSRDVLKEVPAIVKRILRLSYLTLRGISGPSLYIYEKLQIATYWASPMRPWHSLVRR